MNIYTRNKKYKSDIKFVNIFILLFKILKIIKKIISFI